jgi:glutathione S-transferase
MSLARDVVHSLSQISSVDDAHSWAASALRGTRGLLVVASSREHPPRPALPLELYDFEACPYCRKVREVMTELDLSYISRACPKGATRNRRELVARGGRQQVPYLLDPNTGVAMYESEEIITYLDTTYGAGRRWSDRILAPWNTATAVAASIVRPRGRRVRPGVEGREPPKEALILYNIEASPYCRKVREALVELDLDVMIENVGKGSRRREELAHRGGKVRVPYLIDPNEDVGLYESDAIVAYLEATYGATRR